MVFVFLLGLGAFMLATVAGYFSIYGLASIFSGWFWPVIAMGIAVEYGKLIAASYLFRYSHIISKRSKMYGYGGVIVAMILTSVGIFGFLSQGYQQDTLSLKQQEQSIVLIQEEQQELIEFKQENIDRKKQIDKDIAALPNNFITGRQRLMESYGPELETIKKDIASYTEQINEKTLKLSEIKQEKLINEVHIGPIIFIAQSFGVSTDEAVKWLIFMLMFVFDPMAVWLTIATNKVILEEAKKNRVEPIVDEPLKVNKTTDKPPIDKKTIVREKGKDTSSDVLPAHSLRNQPNNSKK